MWNMERIGLWSVFEMSAIKLLLAEKELCFHVTTIYTQRKRMSAHTFNIKN